MAKIVKNSTYFTYLAYRGRPQGEGVATTMCHTFFRKLFTQTTFASHVVYVCLEPLKSYLVNCALGQVIYAID